MHYDRCEEIVKLSPQSDGSGEYSGDFDLTTSNISAKSDEEHSISDVSPVHNGKRARDESLQSVEAAHVDPSLFTLFSGHKKKAKDDDGAQAALGQERPPFRYYRSLSL